MLGEKLIKVSALDKHFADQFAPIHFVSGPEFNLLSGKKFRQNILRFLSFGSVQLRDVVSGGPTLVLAHSFISTTVIPRRYLIK
jgi:hypothetical protein